MCNNLFWTLIVDINNTNTQSRSWKEVCFPGEKTLFSACILTKVMLCSSSLKHDIIVKGWSSARVPLEGRSLPQITGCDCAAVVAKGARAFYCYRRCINLSAATWTRLYWSVRSCVGASSSKRKRRIKDEETVFHLNVWHSNAPPAKETSDQMQ